jgi:hypothetical protein
MRVEHALRAVDDAVRALTEDAMESVVVDVGHLLVLVHLDVQLRRHRHLLPLREHAAPAELLTVASLHVLDGPKLARVANVDGKLFRRDARRQALARHISSVF